MPEPEPIPAIPVGYALTDAQARSINALVDAARTWSACRTRGVDGATYHQACVDLAAAIDATSPTGERPEEALGTLVDDVQTLDERADRTEEERDAAQALARRYASERDHARQQRDQATAELVDRGDGWHVSPEMLPDTTPTGPARPAWTALTDLAHARHLRAELHGQQDRARRAETARDAARDEAAGLRMALTAALTPAQAQLVAAQLAAAINHTETQP